MSYKPILFNTAMVQAIIDGRKTCTRRVIKPQPTYELRKMTEGTHKGEWHEYSENPLCDPVHKSPWGFRYPLTIADIGDILWVREKFNNTETISTLYAADKEFIDFGCKKVDGYLFMEDEIKWSPSIHMPREAARIFLHVTDVRVERLQDITEGQAKLEGVITNNAVKVSSYRYWFEQLWNSTIPKKNLDLYGWNANPFCWVIEFERCKMPKDWR